jgi:hypothetical protein
MAVPSVTNAQVQVSVIQMQWSPEAGAKGTFDQADPIFPCCYYVHCMFVFHIVNHCNCYAPCGSLIGQ